MWADVQGKPIALTVVDRLLVAVEFETPSFDRTTQSAILQKAHSAAGLIQ
jgi:hypothetical protein